MERIGPAAPPGIVHPNSAVKAETLLRQRLGDSRWRLFQDTGTLMVPSRRWPGLDYRLRYGHPVEAIDRGALKATLCAVPRHGEPEADRLLTILDLIETDERKLWEMAKVSYAGPWAAAAATMPVPGALPPAIRPPATNCACCGGHTGSEMASGLWGGIALCSPCWHNWSGNGSLLCFLKWLIGRPSVRCHPTAPHWAFNPSGLIVALALVGLILVVKLGFL